MNICSYQPLSVPTPRAVNERFSQLFRAVCSLQAGGGSGYILPTASGSVLGGIKVGSGLSIDGSGVLSTSGGGGSIGGTIAATQVAFGSGANTIAGEGDFTYESGPNRLNIGNSTSSSNGIIVVGGSGTGTGTVTGGGGALIVEGGDLTIQSNPTHFINFKTNTIERFRIDNSGAWLLASDAGTSGQKLTSNGTGAVPTWEDSTDSPIGVTDTDTLYSIEPAAEITGSNNIYFGLNAGVGNDSDENIFLGINAGVGTNGVSNSIALGNSSLLNVRAVNMIGIGSSAGEEATNATNGIFIGNAAGIGAEETKNAIFLGHQTGTGGTQAINGETDYSILIGRYTRTGGFSNSILLGGAIDFSPISNTMDNQLKFAPNLVNWQIRDIDYVMPSQLGESGSVLTDVAGDGVLSWEDIGNKFINLSEVTGDVEWDFTLGNIATLVITEDDTLDITNISEGSIGVLYIQQDGTGGHSITFPGNSIFTNGITGIESGPGEWTSMGFTYISGNFRWSK